MRKVFAKEMIMQILLDKRDGGGGGKGLSLNRSKVDNT